MAIVTADVKDLVWSLSLLFQQALARRHRLLLFTHAGLFKVLALLHFRQDAGLFARLFKAPKCLFKGLIVADSHQCQEISPAFRMDLKVFQV